MNLHASKGPVAEQKPKIHYGLEMVIGPDGFKTQIVVPAAADISVEEISKRSMKISDEYVDLLRNGNQTD